VAVPGENLPEIDSRWKQGKTSLHVLNVPLTVFSNLHDLDQISRGAPFLPKNEAFFTENFGPRDPNSGDSISPPNNVV